MIIKCKPFNIKKALKGKPFTWAEQLMDPHRDIANGEFDVLYVLNESRTQTLRPETYIIQSDLFDEPNIDDIFAMHLDEMEQKFVMLPKELKDIFYGDANGEIYTNFETIQ